MTHTDVIEAVIGLANDSGPFATVTRGALPTGQGITGETSDGTASARFLSKDGVFQVPVVFNAKHANLKTALDALSKIMTHLTRLWEYPETEGWKIVQIMSNTLPTIVTREEKNLWVVGCSVLVEYYLRGE